MKISCNWLKEYVSTGLSPDQLARKLTMAGLEVEKIISVGGDKVFEMEITPNRPDCLSMVGIAREASVILNKARKFPKISTKPFSQQKCQITIEDKKGCSRYVGTLIEGVKTAKAPGTITAPLKSIGLRPINNIVDITNFCLMETGQPLHAFDYDKLAGGKIIVRRARKGEKIVTIDDIERVLDPSVLVIADAKRPVAIAGIMGGKETEVTGHTGNILLESAYFDPVLIRRASRKLGLSSDSSYRFERGVDHDFVLQGARRAIDLILRHARGAVTGFTDKTVPRQKQIRPTIVVSKGQINHYLGTSVSAARIKNILKKLDLKCTSNRSGRLRITPPPFRKDLREAVDIIEEIARIVGYDNLPLSHPQVRPMSLHANPDMTARHHIRNLLLSQGLNEVVTYALMNRQDLESSGQSDLNHVAVLNPLSRDQEIMRPSLLPGLLAVVRSNINRGQKNLKLFEIGHIYSSKGERETLGIIMTGARRDDWRDTEKKDADYYDLKGALERVLERRGIGRDKIRYETLKEPFFTSGHSAAVVIGGKHIGTIGKIEDRVLARWDIKNSGAYFAKVDLKRIYDLGKIKKKYVPVSEFPAISRDISMAVKKDVRAQSIEEAIRQSVGPNESVVLDDLKFMELYQGSKIPKGHRGLVYSLTYRSRQARTLRDEEVERVHKKVCDRLFGELGAVQR